MRTRALLIGCVALASPACGDNDHEPQPWTEHGPIAAGISGPMGDPLPTATADELAAFQRGKELVEHRFRFDEGLGPVFNVTFCGGCHDKPTMGGSAGLYRSFFLGGDVDDTGTFNFTNFINEFSCGGLLTPFRPPRASLSTVANGTFRLYDYGAEYGSSIDDPLPLPRPEIIAQRNPVPFFGAGLLNEIPEAEILRRADPEDRDGDGISGRPNYNAGRLGRFGRKAQDHSVEQFVRGPLFNHMGLTTAPLTEEENQRLPMQAPDPEIQALRSLGSALRAHAQVALPSVITCDLDGVPDPEISSEELFDIVNFVLLLAAPEIEPLTDDTRRGMQTFDELGCSSCHAPRLAGPRGPIPAYSDLLLHDMGPELADGLVFEDAQGYEFRTQPLWGLVTTGPYLHDGRAGTIDAAIRWHGGEAEAARDRYAALPEDERNEVLEFLRSLGGRNQYTEGLLPPNAAVPSPGEFGAPLPGLSSEELEEFLVGRVTFDRELVFEQGVGAPRFNGDSCRACHFEPVIGGAAPNDVNVRRHGLLDEGGNFFAPEVGTILHRMTSSPGSTNAPQDGVSILEHRQPQPLFGMGLVDRIPDAVIIANEDPFDMDADGISGRVARVDGDRLGRFGWKAQVPSIEEFVRDAAMAELGVTLPEQDQLTYGFTEDDDDRPDPELGLDRAAELLRFITLLGPPPRAVAANPAQASEGEVLFGTVGCVKCHVASLDSPSGPVPLYSDLLLHDILPPGSAGIEDFTATMREFRTAPLWGIRATAPYTHSGTAATLDEAIRLHDGEAAAIRDAYLDLSQDQRNALIVFLETL